MLRAVYERVLRLSASPNAPLWLAVVSFAESSVFPIPPDVLLIPMVLARPRRAWALAALCTLASVLGGMLGYYIGYALFARVALPILRFYHYQAAFETFRQRYVQYGLWLILIKGLTPIPFKIVTIASGAAGFSFPVFVAAAALTRGVRFFLVAGLLRAFGEPVRDFVERRLTAVTMATLGLILVGFVALRYI